jgi:hypothetical protein
VPDVSEPTGKERGLGASVGDPPELKDASRKMGFTRMESCLLRPRNRLD